MTDRSTMRAEAVAVMAMAIEANIYGERAQEPPRPYSVLAAEAALDALLSPRVATCSECGGRGCWRTFATEESTRQWTPNPDCDHGEVSSPPLAVLMGELEQVTAHELANHLCDEAWAGRWDLRDELNTRPRANITALALAPLGLYRIASGESSP